MKLSNSVSTYDCVSPGVGIATSLLVVKPSTLKVPSEMTPNNPAQAEENSEKNENCQLEGKIQKWKSLYRNEKPVLEKSDDSKNSGHLPGLKEAHKQLSLENYKLKKAYSDIQKQLDLMKVMSWHRRAQVDKMRQNDQLNMSYVVGMLKRELQYLEEVYFREKRLADMWRNEEKDKSESSPNTWKYFKDRWNKKYHREQMDEVCMDNQECEGETGLADDTSGSTKETTDHSGTIDTPTKDSAFSNYASEPDNMYNGEKGDFGTIDEAMVQYNEDKIKQHEKRQASTDHGNVSKENLLWRHLRLANAVEDEDLKDIEQEENRGTSSSSDETESGDQNEEASSSNNEQPNVTNKGSDVTTNKEISSRQESDWFSYEILEMDSHIIIAYENVDSVPHVLYGFLNGEFREIESGPGDIFVASIKNECFDVVNNSFVVSLLNSSPKPIEFFAFLPNGKVNHQKINEQVKVIMVGSKDGEEIEDELLVYDATVMEDGNLKVEKQNDGESSEIIDENQDGGAKNSDEYSDDKLEINENHGEESDEDQEKDSTNDDQSGEENKIENEDQQDVQAESGKTSQPNQEVPLSELQPGESYIFEPRTGKIYRRRVSLHQYPISDYEMVVAQTPTKQEEVYYRFPGNMIIEKFIVKDSMVERTAHASISEDEEDSQRKNTETVNDIDDISDTLQQYLQQNTWTYGEKTSILMTFDGTTGIITTVFVTLFKIDPDDVISHDVLNNGRIETTEENVKITSYLLYQNQLLQVIREDKVFHSHNTIDDEETDETLDETGEENPKNLKDKVNKSSDSEKEDNISSDSMDNQEPDDDSLTDSSEATLHDDNEEETHNEECTLQLGDRDTTEYWTYDEATFVRETVERVIPTPKYREEDFEKLGLTTNDIEESVSYIYCDDGSVQKTWRRVEKDVQNGAPGENIESYVGGPESVEDDDENLHDDYEYDDEEYRDDIDDDKYHDIDDEEYHDDIDDKISDDDNDDVGHDSHDDSDDDIEYESEDYDSDDPNYADVDIGDDINNSDNTDDGRSNPESELENEVGHAQNVDKENYEVFILREWQNLKLRQQQFENSRKENMKLQQQMLEEWNKMKQQYKEFQENLQKKQISELDVEIAGKWNELKHQQKQFDQMKKEIEDELRRSLHEEWEKLKKKQAEIETREKQTYKDDENIVRYDEIIGYRMKGLNIHHQQEEAREMQVETTRDELDKYYFDTESLSKTTEEDEMEEKNDDNAEEESIRERLHVQGEKSYVDKIESDAWELSDSDGAQDMDIEENLPHELPYIPKADETSHVDKVFSESWELNEETGEEEYTTEGNLPHEVSYIPLRDSDATVETTIFKNPETTETYQAETFSPHASSTESNRPHITNDGILMLGVNDDDGYAEETGEEAFINFQIEDTEPSSQLELQIQKLREELDRLYEAKQSQKNKIQVFKNDMEISASETDNVQPKCQAKCPITPSDSECPPKCSETDSTEDVSPIYFTRLPFEVPEHNSKTQSLSERPDQKEKQSAFSKIFHQETKQPTNNKKNKKKSENLAFMDYVEGHAYLQQLEPEEKYDEKILGLKNGPLVPGKNRKKKSKKKKNDFKKKTKQSEYLKAEDRGEHEPYKPKKENGIKTVKRTEIVKNQREKTRKPN